MPIDLRRRIAATARDPIPIMAQTLEVIGPAGNIELAWASPREVLNLLQADAIGCHIITVTHGLLERLPTLGRDLTEFSLETVTMFHAARLLRIRSDATDPTLTSDLTSGSLPGTLS